MNENNSKKPDEGRLIDYLLNESSPEERVEIEGLCSQNTDWNKAKTELEHTLGLIENACKKPVPEIEGAMELDPKRRQELESLRSGKDAEPVEQSDQNAETGERALLFKPVVWVPLAAAACAALLVWGPGRMESETQEQQLASAVSEPEESGKKEKSPATATDKATFASEQLGLAKSDDADADPSTSLAFPASRLKESQDAPAEDEAVVQKELIANLDRSALQGADEVLGRRTARNVESLNSSIANDIEAISLADAFAGPVPEPASANFSIDSDSDALPPQPGALAFHSSIPAPVPPAPTAPLAKAVAENPAIDKISSGTSGRGPEVGAAAGFVAESATELEKLTEDENTLALRRAASDDLLAINKLQNSAADFTTDTVRGREFSDNKDSAKTRKNNTLYSAVDQKRSKPVSWTDLVRKPSSCFLFKKDGQALGEVVVMQSAGKTSVIRRMGEIRRGKRFLLTPGQFELRMTDQLGSVVIISGELKRKAERKALESKEAESGSKGSRDGDYEFEAKEAWWLDQSEVRQALPVNELAR
jgi:hypothetical protein